MKILVIALVISAIVVLTIIFKKEKVATPQQEIRPISNEPVIGPSTPSDRIEQTSVEAPKMTVTPEAATVNQLTDEAKTQLAATLKGVKEAKVAQKQPAKPKVEKPKAEAKKPAAAKSKKEK